MQNNFTFNNTFSDLNSTNIDLSSYFDPGRPQRRSSLGNIGLQSSQLNEFSSLSSEFYQPLTPFNSHPNLIQSLDTSQDTSNLFQLVQVNNPLYTHTIPQWGN